MFANAARSAAHALLHARSDAQRDRVMSAVIARAARDSGRLLPPALIRALIRLLKQPFRQTGGAANAAATEALPAGEVYEALEAGLEFESPGQRRVSRAARRVELGRTAGKLAGRMGSRGSAGKVASSAVRAALKLVNARKKRARSTAAGQSPGGGLAANFAGSAQSSMASDAQGGSGRVDGSASEPSFASQPSCSCGCAACNHAAAGADAADDAEPDAAPAGGAESAEFDASDNEVRTRRGRWVRSGRNLILWNV